MITKEQCEVVKFNFLQDCPSTSRQVCANFENCFARCNVSEFSVLSDLLKSWNPPMEMNPVWMSAHWRLWSWWWSRQAAGVCFSISAVKHSRIHRPLGGPYLTISDLQKLVVIILSDRNLTQPCLTPHTCTCCGNVSEFQLVSASGFDEASYLLQRIHYPLSLSFAERFFAAQLEFRLSGVD